MLKNAVAVMGLRLIQGLAEGVTIPASFGILGWWAPHQERSGPKMEMGFLGFPHINSLKSILTIRIYSKSNFLTRSGNISF